MNEIVVVSGKGGTGKTTLLAYLASTMNGAVTADCDVDAPNLHLLLTPQILRRERFTGMKVATIVSSKCTNCGKCIPLCRFGALKCIGNDHIKKVAIDKDSCEGCAICSRICPSRAVEMVDKRVGEWFISQTVSGKMVHALLDPGEDNSGKLVAMVKQQARMVAKEEGAETILVDGPPGIGCPVISALSGGTLAVVVTEPTESGFSDAKRVLDLANGFGMKTALVTNKADINPDMTARIEEHAAAAGAHVVGRVPYDESLARAMARGEGALANLDSPAVKTMAEIRNRILCLCE